MSRGASSVLYEHGTGDTVATSNNFVAVYVRIHVLIQFVGNTDGLEPPPLLTVDEAALAEHTAYILGPQHLLQQPVRGHSLLIALV